MDGDRWVGVGFSDVGGKPGNRRFMDGDVELKGQEEVGEEGEIVVEVFAETLHIRAQG